jgi:hypothetical protein
MSIDLKCWIRVRINADPQRWSLVPVRLTEQEHVGIGTASQSVVSSPNPAAFRTASCRHIPVLFRNADRSASVSLWVCNIFL